MIEHGIYTISYAHLYTCFLKKVDIINAGDKIGITGNTGRSTGDHLHLTVRCENKLINPITIINPIKNYILFTNKKVEDYFL